MYMMLVIITDLNELCNRNKSGDAKRRTEMIFLADGATNVADSHEDLVI